MDMVRALRFAECYFITCPAQEVVRTRSGENGIGFGLVVGPRDNRIEQSAERIALRKAKDTSEKLVV